MKLNINAVHAVEVSASTSVTSHSEPEDQSDILSPFTSLSDDHSLSSDDAIFDDSGM